METVSVDPRSLQECEQADKCGYGVRLHAGTPDTQSGKTPITAIPGCPYGPCRCPRKAQNAMPLPQLVTLP